MPEVRKQWYRNEAKRRNGHRPSEGNTPARGRMDCTTSTSSMTSETTSPLLRDREAEREAHNRQSMLLLQPLLAVNGTNIKEQTFVFVAFNVLVKTFDDTFYPIEATILQYSLKDGVKAFHHQYIHFKIPEGYAAQAKENAGDVGRTSYGGHRMPIFGEPLPQSLGRKSETRTEEFCDFMLQFLRIAREGFQFKNSDTLKTILFCPPSQAEQTQGCLSTLAEESAFEDIKSFVKNHLFVVEAQFLMTVLFRLAGRDHILPVTERYLKSVDYSGYRLCSYHNNNDVHMCTQDVVFRMAFIFSDYLLPHFEIDPTPNHLPEERKNSIRNITTLQNFAKPQEFYSVRQGSPWHAGSQQPSPLVVTGSPQIVSTRTVIHGPYASTSSFQSPPVARNV